MSAPASGRGPGLPTPTGWRGVEDCSGRQVGEGLFPLFSIRSRLYVAEQVVFAFFAYVTIAALAVHLGTRDFCFVITLNALTLATLVTLRRNRARSRWLAAALGPVSRLVDPGGLSGIGPAAHFRSLPPSG